MDTMKAANEQRTSFSWWSHRSFLERLLTSVAFISLVFCIIAMITLLVLSYRLTISDGRKSINSKSKVQQKLCLTPGCIKAAAEILSYINKSVNPCDDFYAFSCGNWLRKTVIPEDQSWASIWITLRNELQRRLLELIKTIGHDTPQYMQNVKNSFDACMNTTEIERLGSEPLRDVLYELGGWPVVENTRWDPYFFDWMGTLISIRKLGLDHDIFLKLSVTADIRNNARHIIQLDQPYLGIDYTYLLNGLEDPAVAAYYKLMVNSAVMLGAKVDVAEKEMLETLQFETALANIYVHREDRRNISKNYNKMLGSDLHKLAPEIEWNIYFDMLLDQHIPAGEEIIVQAPTYVHNLSEILEPKVYGEEKKKRKRVIANYMMWRIVLKSMPLLNQKWRDLIQKYHSVLTGKIRESDRWMQCLNMFTWKLSGALGSIYARSYLDQETRGQVAMIADYVYKAFLKKLRSVKWMDNETKRKAEKKAKNMIMYISYPDELLDHDKLSFFYSGLYVDPNNHFGNFKDLNKWKTDFYYSKLRKPRKRGDWKNWYGIPIVNAFYHPDENALEIPGGLLQDFFFSPERPNYLNFGTVGSVIGHEITHGFDDKGRQYDHVGNNFNWWKEDTDSNFKERAQCMVDQYANYNHSEIGMSVNGINTLGENIADNAAVKEAFWAYKQWVLDNEEELSLPSLKYTPAQLFWISFAMCFDKYCFLYQAKSSLSQRNSLDRKNSNSPNVAEFSVMHLGECAKQRLEDLKNQIMLDSHSPSYNRVIGPVANSEEFSREFNCPVGSPMNPIKKCIVW